MIYVFFPRKEIVTLLHVGFIILATSLHPQSLNLQRKQSYVATGNLPSPL